MTIVVTGGGSGGHITPLLAVAAELKKLQPDTRIVYIGQKGDPFADVVAKNEHIDDTRMIFAGKFRRYHGEGWRQLLDIKTILLNIRDGFYFLAGCVQMIWLLRQIKPVNIFVKGGFVGVPVGLAAALWRMPYITHDSDAIPGLANRIIARWASLHAVALPKENYSYPQEKTVTVGVPIAREFEFVTKSEQLQSKKYLTLPQNSDVLLITGGGLGAQSINDAIVSESLGLLDAYPKLHIVHMTGRKNYKPTADSYKKVLSDKLLSRVIIKDYVEDMYRYSSAADVIVARAGATNMAEFATQGKACIIIPSPVLAGGHQLKNAKAYMRSRAIKVVEQDELDSDSGVLAHAIHALMNSEKNRDSLAKQLHTFAHPHSAQMLAELLVEGQQPESEK
jgi:UDP-N-acetylglucosamine--N-acetylmuramyl-(pentapeptide) pyrophosphoryl-undecaprenol N-acetylglucosamine transferase